ncbi:MAG: MFS transporter [Chloroflexi bacterium]|nr:MFS transporter [Chloroflexota bacterium]
MAEKKFFYGWIIVAVCGFVLLITFGIRLSFAVFFVVLLDKFGWARADTSLIFSVSMIVFMLASTLAGIALDKWGVRRVFSVGAGLLAIGLLLSSRIHTLTQLTFTYGVIAGLGITILGLGPQASVIARWFVRRRGLAIGMTFAGTGLGTLLLTPGTAVLISQIGWRHAYIALALLTLLMIPFILLFLRLSPNLMGLFPDGERPSATYPRHINSSTQTGWTMPQIVRSPAFWLLILAGLGAIGPLRMLTVHQLATMADSGVDRILAASIVGLTGAVTAVAFIFWGSLSDRIGRRQAYTLGSLCLLAAILILGSLQAASGTIWLLAYALMLGLGEGSRASLVTAVASDLFPGPALGTVNGAVGSAFGAGAALFPWLAGRLFDQSGSYNQAFQIGALAIGVSLLALWIAPLMVRRP